MFKAVKSDEIYKKIQKELEERKKKLPYDMLGRSLASNPFFPKDVHKTLKRINYEIKLIPQIKEDLNQNLSLALESEKKGAVALSISTWPYFNGVLENLSMIRRYTQIPLLREDFIIDEYQILETLVYGGDFILLIAKMLSTKELKKLVEFARHLGLEVLVEICDKEDLSKTILAGADLISICNVDKNFTNYTQLCEKLIGQIPNSKIIIASVNDGENLQYLQKLGIDAFLVNYTNY
ncbi:indole-3-glycerol-phosphate synthase [Campylobacter sp. RM10532]|uniref:indole-3-glycerol phosphate synthase TrpC n=1 Tax=Campylobacter molothri TaxID=1032242 RepID=UPI001DEFB68B|nr:indole-3-glycerol-phosphate synthase [Campylobacter sp. RM10532]MBZ7946372.1 indole-3-glycerol-phosphate synthase [Campylobacter sp. RM10536]MBZ7952430.1 indole-3-glycerol-phosphate synthase [Campylobacter sp. RM9939]MBZ7955350.1 indole-3-glycerol-phosphate synthase [Campylobacter sp. RM17709]MBZ7956628.1 indole-3-glycerol-phosphate synthase [Campylobacter sp. RM10541]